MPTVLIVDDDLKLLKMLQRTLVYEGLTVLTAANGRDALHLVDEHNPDLLTVFVDRDGFKQLIIILLDNAIKHSIGPIRVSARQVEGSVEIRVADSGPGVPADKLPPFHP